MKTLIADSNGMTGVVTARTGRARGWQQWTPYAAVIWSLLYAALGLYWALSGRGFPYGGEANLMGPLLGQFGPTTGWTVVTLAGLPAAALGMAMLWGVRGKVLRPLFITLGVLLSAVMLLLMIGLDLLVLVGYTPYTVRALFTGNEIAQSLLKGWAQWTTIHQL